jgi:chromosome partitioning protein
LSERSRTVKTQSFGGAGLARVYRVKMRIIAIANQKGGCGKTTTAVNLAAAFAGKGKRTLIIDLDPQGHATLGLGHNPETFDKTIYHTLTNAQIPISRVVINTSINGLNLAPSNILLSGAELELADVPEKELVLSKQLEIVSNEYEMCVIDCPPSVGPLTLNALVASTGVVVPVQVNYYAMEGLKQLLETVNIIKVYFYPCSVEILGLLLTFVDDRTIFSRQIQQQMREFFGSLVFDTVIHRTVRLAEAPSYGESVLTYAPTNKSAAEYKALAEEIINGRALVEEISIGGALAEEIGNVEI